MCFVLAVGTLRSSTVQMKYSCFETGPASDGSTEGDRNCRPSLGLASEFREGRSLTLARAVGVRRRTLGTMAGDETRVARAHTILVRVCQEQRNRRQQPR
jgi:hypothetical protein